jgi:hypothetical protein
MVKHTVDKDFKDVLCRDFDHPCQSEEKGQLESDQSDLCLCFLLVTECINIITPCGVWHVVNLQCLGVKW